MAVVEQGSQNRAVTYALERICGRRIEQPAGLGVAQARRAAFIAVGHRPLDAIHGIADDEDGERLLKPFAHAGGRARISILEAPREILQEAPRDRDVGLPIGAQDDRADPGPLALGEMFRSLCTW
jgi:hypothetical protein